MTPARAARARIALLVLAAGAGACGEGSPTAPRDDARPAATRTAEAAPARCAPADVAAVLERFTTSLSRGDVRAARSSFAARGGDPPFRWFAAKPGDPARTGRRAFHAAVPGELTAYFRARRAQREHLTLESVASRASGRIADVEFTLVRRARDLERGRAEGKAEVDCSHGVITALVMSPRTAATGVGALCPGRQRPGRILACARRS